MRATFEFITCSPPASRVRIVGDLDLDTADRLEDVLESLQAVGCTRVELDLDEVTFVDLPVLDLLHHEQRRLRLSGGDLRVVAASPSFGELCERTEMASLLPDPAETERVTTFPTPPPGA